MWIFRESVEPRGIGIGGGIGGGGNSDGVGYWGIVPGEFEVEGPVDIVWRRDIYFLGDE